MQPIWKDYYVNLGTATLAAGLEYSIVETEDDATIFSGRAYPKYNNSTVRVRINDICAEYLRNGLLTYDDFFSRGFLVLDGEGTEVDAVTFYDDWSYDPEFDLERDGLSFPVVRTFAPGQVLLYSVVSGTPTAVVHLADGSSVNVQMKHYYRQDDFNNDFNYDFAQSALYYGSAFGLDLRDYPTAVAVEIGGKRWVRSAACPRFVLYYKNAYGGWDALPIEGQATKEDAVTRHTSEQVYDNGQPYNRGRNNYLNELKRRYTLHTGWLNLQQSALMHHPLNAVNPFLHDLETGRINAVVLTGSTTEYKNAPGKLYAYKIEAELAQERIRR